MSLIKNIVLVAFCLLALGVHSQGETANWYFGQRAGIQFNPNGSVTALTDGRINTFEGCASISGANGNLLFYTDGITVYDQNHNIMQNGTGLYGDPSSTQSAIIVPKPEDPTQLYIFTVDTSIAEDDPNRGLNYSVVDMQLNNGNGAVTQKNVPLLARCSEKIAAVVKDCFDQSIWVLTLAQDQETDDFFSAYYAFEVNTNGVSTNPIKSSFNDLSIQDPRGYLKFSADGQLLASANASAGLFLYNFDKTTGQVSNQQPIALRGTNPFPYGLEFSPNQQYLYVHSSNDAPADELNVHSSSLFQLDLLAANISGSAIEIDSRPIYRGALQLGENGKIYRTIAENYLTGTAFLGVINNPNERGNAANYQHNAVSLGGRNATQGLPPFIQSFFDKVDLINTADGSQSGQIEICAGENLMLEAEAVTGASYSWEKDGLPLVNDTPILTLNNITATDAGRYTLTITLANPAECPITGEAFVSVQALPEVAPANLVQCDLDPQNATDGFTQFNLQQLAIDPALTYTFYESLVDHTNNNPIITTVGYTNTQAFNSTIYYQASNSFGCSALAPLNLEVISSPIGLQTPEVLYSCDIDAQDDELIGSFDLTPILANYQGFDVNFYPTLNDASLETNALANQITTTNTTIYIRAENNNQCQTVTALQLTVNPLPNLNFDAEILFCTDGPPIEIQAPTGFDTYSWTKQEAGNTSLLGQEQNLSITATGNYILEVGYQYQIGTAVYQCTTAQEFTVIPSNRAVIEQLTVKDLSDNNTVAIVVSGDGDYLYSLNDEDYQAEPFFENVPAGIATLYIQDQNGCGITEEEFAVVGYPKFFTPNGDNNNDTWKIYGADELYQTASLITIYDRFGKLITRLSPTTPGWDGTYNNQALPAADYWFSLQLEDGRTFKGHFSLMR